jgi:hypothetical protein
LTGEDRERLAVPGPRGPQGNQGNQGNRGEHGVPGLSRPVRQALVYMFALAILLVAANFLWTGLAINANNQQRCSSLVADASIPVPQPVKGNPSRLWEARFEAIARHRAEQLHCPGI